MATEQWKSAAKECVQGRTDVLLRDLNGPRLFLSQTGRHLNGRHAECGRSSSSFGCTPGLVRRWARKYGSVARHGLDDESLRIAASIYQVAYLIGDPPTRKVETLLDLPRSTAGRWVTEARKRGYLSAARGPGKAGG